MRALVSESATCFNAPGLFSRLRIKAVSSRNLILAFLSATRAASTSATINRSLPGPVTSGAEKALMLTPAAPSTDVTSANTPGLLCPLTTNCVVVGIGSSPPVNQSVVMSAPISIQPSCSRSADVPDGVRHSGRNEDLLPWCGPETPAAELKLQSPLDRHHQFIGRMHVILPYLPGRINPKITTEAARPPVFGYKIAINHRHSASSHAFADTPYLSLRPTTFEFLHDLRHGRVLHLVEGQAVRLEGTVQPQEVGYSIRIPTRLIIGGIVEHVSRPDQPSVRQLKARTSHARRTIEPGRRGLPHRHRHQRPIVGASHPAFDDPGIPERLQYCADSREILLRPDDHHRIILPHILARDERQFFRGGCGSNGAVGTAKDILHRVAPRRTDEHQQIIQIFRAVERDLLVLIDVMHLEAKALVQGGGDDQAGGGEGIGKHLIQREVPGPGRDRKST